MKVSVYGNGNPVTSDQVKSVIDLLNKEYSSKGLTVKNLTMYIRFQDPQGRVVEPVRKGKPLDRKFSFTMEQDVSSAEVSDNSEEKPLATVEV